MMMCFPLKKSKKAELALLFPLSCRFEQRSARVRRDVSIPTVLILSCVFDDCP